MPHMVKGAVGPSGWMSQTLRTKHLAGTLALSLFLLMACPYSGFSVDSGAKALLFDYSRPGVDIEVDKGDGAVYHVGELLTVHVKCERDGYLTIFDMTADGEVYIIFPNQYHPDNFLKAGELTIPGASDPFLFEVDLPEGTETLVAVLTEEPVEFKNLEYIPSKAFIQVYGTQPAIAQAIVDALREIPPGVWWALDTCTFYVERAEAHQVENWALIIGINDYDDSTFQFEGVTGRFPKLHYCVADAEAWKDLLAPHYSHVKLLLDQDATYAKIKDAFTNWLAESAPDATVVIFYSGHGYHQRDRNGDEEDGQDEAWVPVNFAKERKLVIDDEISSWIRALPARRVVLISDSCHSGTLERGLRTFQLLGGTKASLVPLSDGLVQDFSRFPVRGLGKLVALQAARANEYSYEDSTLGHGLFTYFLLEAFRGTGDEDGDGVVTVQEAFRYARREVTARKPTQHPQIYDEVHEPVILLRE